MATGFCWPPTAIRRSTCTKNTARDIALVILDMVMPGMGGEETFLKMKEINPNIRALLSTGYSQDGRVSEILSKGVKGFIQKPYDFNQLLAKLRQILEQRSKAGNVPIVPKWDSRNAAKVCPEK